MSESPLDIVQRTSTNDSTPQDMTDICENTPDCPSKSIGLCSYFDSCKIPHPSHASSHSSVSRDRVLIHQGKPSFHVLSVLTGSLMISRISENGRRYVSDFIWPGEFIGLLNERKSAYSATALETTQICRHSHAQLSASISNSLKLAQRLLIRKNDELSVSQNHAMVLGLGTAKAKLAHFLIALQERQGVLRNKIISRVDLPMRRTDISDHLGMTPETLSREFQQLVREKLIISIPKGAMILARDTLIGITEAD